jgi:cytochrome o ubiquinol oxidase subunit 1
VLAFYAFVAGFALVWHILWLAGLALSCIVVACLLRAWQTEHEVELNAADFAGRHGARP